MVSSQIHSPLLEDIYLLTYDSYVPVYNRFHRGEWITRASGREGALDTPMPEFIDPVFTKTSPKRSFSLNRKRAFWLVFAKTESIISGTGPRSVSKKVSKNNKNFLQMHCQQKLRF
jgi:hypothetical protein